MHASLERISALSKKDNQTIFMEWNVGKFCHGSAAYFYRFFTLFHLFFFMVSSNIIYLFLTVLQRAYS